MYKLIVTTLLILLTYNLFPQEIKLNSNRLLFTPDSIVNEITVYNIGIKPLVIDSIYAHTYLAYGLDIILKDTTIQYSVYIGYKRLSFTIEANDSAKFIFGYPICEICKGSNQTEYIDTIFVHSNSIINSKTLIYVEGYITNVKNGNSLANDFILYQNFPNPFNPITTIKYYIPRSSFITLKIYDMLGNEIKTLVSEQENTGKYSVSWDGTNNKNERVSSSMYFYKLEVNRNQIIHKMILLK